MIAHFAPLFLLLAGGAGAALLFPGRWLLLAGLGAAIGVLIIGIATLLSKAPVKAYVPPHLRPTASERRVDNIVAIIGLTLGAAASFWLLFGMEVAARMGLVKASFFDFATGCAAGAAVTLLFTPQKDDSK